MHHLKDLIPKRRFYRGRQLATPLTAIGIEVGLALEQSDGQLVGVQVLQVLAEVVVQEPGGKTLKHDVQL